jgi:hypothetical protein
MNDIQSTMRQLQPGDKLVMTFQKSQKPFWAGAAAGGGGDMAGAAPAGAPMGISLLGPRGSDQSLCHLAADIYARMREQHA